MKDTAFMLASVVQLLTSNMTPEQLHAAAATLRAREVENDAEREFNESFARGFEQYAKDKTPAEPNGNEFTEPDGIVRSADIIYQGRVVDTFVADDYDTVVRTGIEYLGNIAWDAAHDAFGDNARRSTGSVTLKFKRHPEGTDLNAVAVEHAVQAFPVLQEAVDRERAENGPENVQ